MFEENTKEEKRERERERDKKNRKWCLKSRQNGRYNNGDQKGSFLFTKRNKRTGMKRREKFCGRRKKNDERERGPEIKRTELRQRLFLKKRDQNKGIKIRSRKNGKRHTLKKKTILTRRCSQKACQQQQVSLSLSLMLLLLLNTYFVFFRFF